jgi:glycolate oxidase iron-sulfur subunit
MMTIERIRGEIDRCNRCGFCQAACPVFRATGREDGVARGRLALLGALAEGKLDWSPDIEHPIFACLLCGACTANCFPAIPTADLMTLARQEYLTRTGRKPLHRLLFDHILPSPHLLRLAAKTAAVAQKGALPQAAEALGLLRVFGHDLPGIVEIFGQPLQRPLRDRIVPQTFPGQGPALSIAYFVGCGMDLICPDAGEATVKLLCGIGREVHILANNCCGLPAQSYGDLNAARNLAERNLKYLADNRFDLIVTDCSSCASFLKKYPQLFTSSDERYRVSMEIVRKIRDLTEILDPLPQKKENQTQDIVVTYHDPCHAVRGQGISRPPRELLDSLPGIVFRDMDEADWCCGGAGSYAVSHFELARRIIDRKINNVKKTGADFVITSCPSCVLHLDYGCRINGLTTRALHLSQFLQNTASYRD